MSLFGTPMGERVVALKERFPQAHELWRVLLVDYGYETVLKQVKPYTNQMPEDVKVDLAHLCYDLYGFEEIFKVTGQVTRGSKALWPYFPVKYEEVLEALGRIKCGKHALFLATLLNRNGWVTREFYEAELWVPLGKAAEQLEPTYELAEYLLLKRTREIKAYRNQMRRHLIGHMSRLGYEDLLIKTEVEDECILKWRLQTGVGVADLDLGNLRQYSQKDRRLIGFRGAQHGRMDWVQAVVGDADLWTRKGLACGGYAEDPLFEGLTVKQADIVHRIATYRRDFPEKTAEEVLKTFAQPVYETLKVMDRKTFK